MKEAAEVDLTGFSFRTSGQKWITAPVYLREQNEDTNRVGERKMIQQIKKRGGGWGESSLHLQRERESGDMPSGRS